MTKTIMILAIAVAFVAGALTTAIIVTALEDKVPIGTVLAWTGSSIPDDFLLADGSSLLRKDFPELFTVIGTIYGAGTNKTMFKLPDLRDTFIRGTAVNSGVTGGTASHDHSHDHSELQFDVVTSRQAHDHGFNPLPAESGLPSELRLVGPCVLPPACTLVADDSHTHNVNVGPHFTSERGHSHSVEIDPKTSTTTGNEPPFLSLVMIIKAK